MRAHVRSTPDKSLQNCIFQIQTGQRRMRYSLTSLIPFFRRIQNSIDKPIM